MLGTLCATQAAQANTNQCLPAPATVPGLSGAPEWQDFNADGFWRPELDDPRWAGSPLQYLSSLPIGGHVSTGNQVAMRAITVDKILPDEPVRGDGWYWAPPADAGDGTSAITVDYKCTKGGAAYCPLLANTSESNGGRASGGGSSHGSAGSSAAGMNTAQGDAGDSAAGATTTATGGDKGHTCGCRVVGGNSSKLADLAALFALGIALRRRRSRTVQTRP